jgi:hypothetical protein
MEQVSQENNVTLQMISPIPCYVLNSVISRKTMRIEIHVHVPPKKDIKLFTGCASHQYYIVLTRYCFVFFYHF